MPRTRSKPTKNASAVSGRQSQGTTKKRTEKKKATLNDKVVVTSNQILVPHSKHNHGPIKGEVPRHGKKVYQNVPVSYATTQKDVCQQPCNFEASALQVALASLVSYLANKGVITNKSAGLEKPWESVYGGVDYILQSICSEIQGGTAKLTTYPKVIGDLIAALLPKTVPFMTFGNQAYSWNPFDGTAVSLTNFVNTTWAAVYVDPNVSLDDPYGVCPRWTGSSVALEDLYSGFLRLITGSRLHPALETVTAEKYKSRLANDASSFARVYVYNGLQVSPTSGYWKDVESEVQITAPVYANFCEYVQPDERTAAKLIPFNGGAEMAVAGRILFEQLSEFNKTPYVFKQIDFEELYTVLVLWMCRAKELTIRNLIGNGDGSAAKPLPFSMQEFRIALRQAIIARFPSQVVGQFNAVLGDTGSNVFRPFNVMANCCARKDALRFQLPSMINENISSLEPRSLQFGGKKGSLNATTFIPVWGIWGDDVPIIPRFQNGDNFVELFTPTTGEIEINLVNGQFGSNGEFANLNGDYYTRVMDDWNFHVSNVAEVVSDIQDMDGDSGPVGLGTLFVTRVIETFVTEAAERVPRPSLRYVESLKYVANSGIPTAPEVKPPLVKGTSGMLTKISPKEKSPTAVPPGSIIRNGVVDTTYNRRLLSEEEGLYEFLILPHVRLSSTEDAISLAMYQTEAREPLSSFSANSVSGSGAGMYSRMEQLAGLCVPGIGKNYSNLYTRTFAHLQDINRGGILSGILAGIVGTAFPAARDVANGIASMVPF